MKNKYLKLIIKESILDILFGDQSKKKKITPSPFYDPRTDTSLGSMGGGVGSGGYGYDDGYGYSHHDHLTHSDREELSDIFDDNSDDGDDDGGDDDGGDD